MSAELLVFYLLAAGAVLGALAVVVPPFGRNPLHGAVALLATFGFLAGIFVLLSAHLVAVLQVLVYVGAVIVLFVFVIMLLNLRREDLGRPRVTPWKVVGVAAVAMTAVKLAMAVADAAEGAVPADLSVDALQGYGQTRDVAADLLMKYFYPFEVTSVLLLVAIIGALVVARKRQGGEA